jgi:PAS domain S-box-containing protein
MNMANSIRTRLTIAFLGLAAGPLLIVGLILILKAYSVQTQEAIALQREMAAHLSSRVQSLIRNLESGLQTLIRIEDLQKLEPGRQKLILSIFHSRQSAIDDLILLDAGGRVLSYHSRLKLHRDLPTQPQKDLESFTAPMYRGVTYFGPVRFQELSGEPLMIMAVPFIDLDTGKPEGVLVADVRLKEIWDLVARIHPGQKGASFIVDAEKRVVAHRNPSVVLRGTRFDPPGFDGVQMGLSGQKSVMVRQIIRFGDQQFHIVVEGPVSEALALAIHTVRIMLAVVLIALLAAGCLGFFTVRLIVGPIEDIAETARAINAGDLSRRVVVKRRDELGVLASAFNRMTQQLQALINDLEKRVVERTAELEIERNKAQQYLDIAGVILVAIDADQRVTLINQKGCEILGRSSEEIVAKDWFETFVPAHLRQGVIRAFRQLMGGNIESIEYFENPVLTQGGEERLIAWHNVLLKDNEGNIIGTLSSGQDISEKKQTEERIIKLNQDLRNRAVELEEVNKELEAFAYSVSHDLRAPLRHIDGFLELLKKKMGTELDEQGRHYMDTISEAARKMGLLIDELLSFSRMGRHAMSFQEVALEELVCDVILELEPDAAGRSVEWRIGDLPVVSGDKAMLWTVLVNLISNALKFTYPREKAQIEIGSQPGQDSEVVIYVRDNGVGFDMTYADKLFGVFQRLHRVDEFEGTGIGLANVRRIIARHSGRTWATGELNKGATFYFSLPEV